MMKNKWPTHVTVNKEDAEFYYVDDGEELESVGNEPFVYPVMKRYAESSFPENINKSKINFAYRIPKIIKGLVFPTDVCRRLVDSHGHWYMPILTESGKLSTYGLYVRKDFLSVTFNK